MSEVEETTPAGSSDDGRAVDEAAENRSLIDDVEVLIEDGKTYLEAELNFQKTRAQFVGDRAKGVALYGLLGLMFAWMALIGLTIGLIFALTPSIGGWGATGVVVAIWLVVAGVAFRAAAGRWRALLASFEPGGEP
uniref:phage holin family protein n=1 Tax=Altererythrobacter segetis TaxID=1104773 RepID=UPI00140BC318|nr:phage holin family protein [Altererythrobacter segetis]